MRFNRIIPKFLRQYETQLTSKPMSLTGHGPDDDQPTIASKLMAKDLEQDEQDEGEWDDVQKAALAEYESKHQTQQSEFNEKMKAKIRLKAQKRKVMQRVAQRQEEERKEESSGKHVFRESKKIKLAKEERKGKKEKAKKIKNKALLSFDLEDE